MVFDAFATVLCLLALGMAMARTTLLPKNAPEVLNLVVLYVCLPAAVLRHVPKLSADPSLIGVALTPWVLFAAAAVLIRIASPIFSFNRPTQAALLLCVGLCNSSFLGFPMVHALLGEGAVAYAVVYDQLGSFMLLSTAGLAVLARQSEGPPPTLHTLALRLARFPPAWALLVALTIMPAEPWPWLTGLLLSLSNAMLPLVMLAVGLSIQLRLPKEELYPLIFGLTTRLALLPALAWLFASAFAMPPLMFRTTVLEAAMPSMVSAAALAMSQGLAPRLCAALVGYGIVLSMLTLPLWAALLNTFGPALP